MVFEYKIGNLLDSNAVLICHQVNCQGKMNSGVAKAIREKYPIVYEKYYTFCQQFKTNESDNSLGIVLPVTINDTQKVMNLFGQFDFGYDGARYTSYDALDECFHKLASYCIENHINNIAFPYHMSSDRGGADWDVILALIESAFKKIDITIEIWHLEK